LEGKRVTGAESEASLTQHRPLNLPGFSAVYFNIKGLLLLVIAHSVPCVSKWRAKARRDNLVFKKRLLR